MTKGRHKLSKLPVYEKCLPAAANTFHLCLSHCCCTSLCFCPGSREDCIWMWSQQTGVMLCLAGKKKRLRAAEVNALLREDCSLLQQPSSEHPLTVLLHAYCSAFEWMLNPILMAFSVKIRESSASIFREMLFILQLTKLFFPLYVLRSIFSAQRDATIWPVCSVTLTSVTAVESATDTWGYNLYLNFFCFPITLCLVVLCSSGVICHLILFCRFFGDHTSNLSVFGCKYRYLPDKPHLRRLIRGSVCGKLVCMYVS